MSNLDKMDELVEKINDLTKQLKQGLRKKPEDYFTSSILGAEGFSRAFHSVPNVRDDMPSQQELEFHDWLDSLSEEDEQ